MTASLPCRPPPAAARSGTGCHKPVPISRPGPPAMTAPPKACVELVGRLGGPERVTPAAVAALSSQDLGLRGPAGACGGSWVSSGELPLQWRLLLPQASLPSRGPRLCSSPDLLPVGQTPRPLPDLASCRPFFSPPGPAPACRPRVAPRPPSRPSGQEECIQRHERLLAEEPPGQARPVPQVGNGRSAAPRPERRCPPASSCSVGSCLLAPLSRVPLPRALSHPRPLAPLDLVLLFPFRSLPYALLLASPPSPLSAPRTMSPLPWLVFPAPSLPASDL